MESDALWITDVARRAAAGNGVLLYGEPGAGQDEMASEVVQRIGARNGQMELSCPPDVETGQQLERLVNEPPAPGLVLFIADLSAFDGPEVELVSRLVIRHGAVVVAVSADPQGAPDAALSRYLRLDRARVLDLSLIRATEYLQRGIGGPLSERAAYTIWNSGAGNRSMMRMISADWVEVGYLVHADGVWVVSGADSPAGPRLVRHWKQRLAQLDPAVRQVFELLALAHDLPLNTVLEICGNAVDTVHELGYLRLEESASRDASLRGAINSAAIADQVPPGRSRDLLEKVTAHLEAAGMPQPVGLVPWKLRCGIDVGADRLLEGAERQLHSFTPMQALELLKKIDPTEVPERAASIKIAALLAAGYFMDTATVSLLLGQVGPHKPSRPMAEGGASETTQTLELIGAAWQGDFGQLLAGHEEPNLPEGVRWLWQEFTHEAQAITGNVVAGLQSCRELLRTLEQTESAPFLIQRSRMGLFHLELATGEWSRAVGTLARGWDAEATAPGREGRGSLYTAIADALAGRLEACLHHLRREIPQLTALERFDVLPLAYSMRAFAWAKSGNRAEALKALASVDQQPIEATGGIWRIRWAGGFFWAHAMALVGRVDEATEWVMAFAARDRELGNVSQELMALSAALQWGHAPAMELLEEAARRSDGRFAEACIWTVRGLKTADPRELEYGALLLRSLGHYLLADFVQEELERLNGPCPEQKGFPTVVAPQGHNSLSGGELVSESAWASLTPRQRAIVDYVLVDDSNAEIARKLGLSVRTIESHLYLAYAKLNVANRAELRGIVNGRSIESQNVTPHT
ncbi:helix-turn-helix transcriptional regulator [Arthrobacter rhombi]|uniref:helix-turn-helix transcriptional regulator n=1 Tax=Arthrobacter rhombi TaxID=71253 RepID=UPI003FD02CF2